MGLRAPTVGETALAGALAALAWAVLVGTPGAQGDASLPAPGGAAAVQLAALPAPPAGVPALPPEVAADPFGGRPWPSAVRTEADHAESEEPAQAAPVASAPPAPAGANEPAPRAIDLEPEHTPG